MIIKIEIDKFEINTNVGLEDCLNEYKEFFLDKNLKFKEIKNLKKGIIEDYLLENIYNCIFNNYIDKYSIKYILSLSNIDKLLLDNL